MGENVLADLIRRVEEATAADREIDGEIWWALCPREAGHFFYKGATGLPRMLDHSKPPPAGLGRASVQANAPAYTSDLTAALSLVERCLPDFTVDITKYRENGGEFKPSAFAKLFNPYGEIREYRAKATTPALALILALLKALSHE